MIFHTTSENHLVAGVGRYFTTRLVQLCLGEVGNSIKTSTIRKTMNEEARGHLLHEKFRDEQVIADLASLGAIKPIRALPSSRSVRSFLPCCCYAYIACLHVILFLTITALLAWTQVSTLQHKGSFNSIYCKRAQVLIEALNLTSEKLQQEKRYTTS
jgi:hypothetical protein